ncbi:MAG: PilZ domain-containing protein [Magnetococcales bacterium]|nr:PilZ domain-containing protein [Magnetococcales bacterium]
MSVLSSPPSPSAKGSLFKPDSDPGSQRRYARIPYHHEMTIVINGGRPIPGRSGNVAVGGVFLELGRVPAEVKKGDEGRLHIELQGSLNEYPCRVVHVGETGLGLHIIEKTEIFGLSVSLGIYDEISQHMGVVVKDKQTAAVTLLPPRGGPIKGQLLRIGLRDMICCLPVDWKELALNTEVNVEITPAGGLTLRLTGLVNSHLKPDGACDERAKSVCRILFQNLQQSAALTGLKELVNTIRQQEIWEAMRSRGGRLGEEQVRTYSSTPYKSPEARAIARKEMMANFQSFFGSSAKP